MTKSAQTAIVILIIGLIGIAVFAYIRKDSTSTEPILRACTMEAKLCPDGSYVGRSGPNCEFAACRSTTAASSTPPMPPAPTPSPQTSY